MLTSGQWTSGRIAEFRWHRQELRTRRSSEPRAPTPVTRYRQQQLLAAANAAASWAIWRPQTPASQSGSEYPKASGTQDGALSCRKCGHSAASSTVSLGRSLHLCNIAESRTSATSTRNRSRNCLEGDSPRRCTRGSVDVLAWVNRSHDAPSQWQPCRPPLPSDDRRTKNCYGMTRCLVRFTRTQSTPAGGHIRAPSDGRRGRAGRAYLTLRDGISPPRQSPRFA